MNISQKRMRMEILGAAKSRFINPGYGKTTMTEIAGDVNISAPHLYNFYKGKLDLAVAIADEVTSNHREILRRSLQRNIDNGCEPGEVLHSYFQLEFDINFKMQSDIVSYQIISSTEYVFELKEDLPYFHNGSRLNIKDIIATLENVISDPMSPLAVEFKNIDKLVKISHERFSIFLKEADINFI